MRGDRRHVGTALSHRTTKWKVQHFNKTISLRITRHPNIFTVNRLKLNNALLQLSAVIYQSAEVSGMNDVDVRLCQIVRWRLKQRRFRGMIRLELLRHPSCRNQSPRAHSGDGGQACIYDRCMLPERLPVN